jgi:hypothetical protein
MPLSDATMVSPAGLVIALKRSAALGLASLALLGCGGNPDDVSFDTTEGTAAGLSDCQCSYHDGTDDDWSLQITCTGANDTFDSVSFFIDPRVTGPRTAVGMIFIPSATAGSFAASGEGHADAVGAPTSAGAAQVIRPITGLEVHWPEQEACEVSHGCQIDSFHLLPGAVRAGEGACEDYYATLNGDLAGTP